MAHPTEDYKPQKSFYRVNLKKKHVLLPDYNLKCHHTFAMI